MTTLPSFGNTPIQGGAVFLHASDEGTHGAWLMTALAGQGLLTSVALDEKLLKARIAATQPRAVFLDFSVSHPESNAPLVATLRQEWPALVLIAFGHANQVQGTLSALRAGVDDFIDLDGPTETVWPLLRERLAQRDAQRPAPRRGKVLALLGARPGLGTTTLACNLAGRLQAWRAQAHVRTASPEEPLRETALLDLGLPARDGLLYLGLQSHFSFVDGVQNLHRLDQTLLQTALPQHPGGVAVLPLPANLGQIREISHTQSVALTRKLTEFFDLQIADLGGFSTVDFLAHMVRQADQVWVVCDQSLGGIISTSALLRDLREREVDTQAFSLVLNRFEPHVDLPARDVASQLGLPLAHVLPSRPAAQLAATTQGKLITQAAPGDPYSQAISSMARGLLAWVDGAPPPEPSGGWRWAERAAQWLRTWKHQG